MTRYLLISVLVVTGCRSGATRVTYVGPPVSQCAAGRAYQPPAAGSESRVALVPVAAATATPPPDRARETMVDEEEPEQEPKATKKREEKKKKKKRKKKGGDQ